MGHRCAVRFCGLFWTGFGPGGLQTGLRVCAECSWEVKREVVAVLSVDRRLGSDSGVGPAGGVQLIVGDGAAVLIRAVGGQVLGSHTGRVLQRQVRGVEKSWS